MTAGRGGVEVCTIRAARARGKAARGGNRSEEDGRWRNVRQHEVDLIRELRKLDVFVLERGTIEANYPATVTGRDKPTRAQQFRNTVTTTDAGLGLCDDQDTDGSGRRAKEFEIIFGANFCN